MNTPELKKNFHNLIDHIDNESILMCFYDLMKKRATSEDGKLWSRLTKEDQESLLLTLEESEQSYNVIDHEEMKKKHGKWL
ncbi:MAG: hypothetical protein HOO86_11170 [Bacteroidales bacterium]|jgi:hypothetical protein|nr:hypothetical protein [Bacteroidales bacterium]